MRFESRYRQLKAIATSTSCNKNLLVTIIKKKMLKMCEMMDSVEFIKKKIKFGSIDEDKVTDVDISDKDTYYKEVDALGLFYKIEMFVVLNIQNSEAEFGEVLKIIWVNDELFFYLNIFEEVTFDDHYHGYIIKKCNNKNPDKTKIYLM